MKKTMTRIVGPLLVAALLTGATAGTAQARKMVEFERSWVYVSSYYDGSGYTFVYNNGSSNYYTDQWRGITFND